MFKQINYYYLIIQIYYLKYLDDLYLVDLTIDDEYKNIDLCEFASPVEGDEESDWQAPYMEQFFAIDKDVKICETYDHPADDAKPVRLLFFIYYVSEKQLNKLITPYRDVKLSFDEDTPKVIRKQIEYEPVD